MVQVPDDEFRIVRTASDGLSSGNEAPFGPLPMRRKIPAAFEFDPIQVSGEAFEFVHQSFPNSTSPRSGRDAKVGD